MYKQCIKCKAWTRSFIDSPYCFDGCLEGVFQDKVHLCDWCGKPILLYRKPTNYTFCSEECVKAFSKDYGERVSVNNNERKHRIRP